MQPSTLHFTKDVGDTLDIRVVTSILKPRVQGFFLQAIRAVPGGEEPDGLPGFFGGTWHNGMPLTLHGGLGAGLLSGPQNLRAIATSSPILSGLHEPARHASPVSRTENCSSRAYRARHENELVFKGLPGIPDAPCPVYNGRQPPLWDGGAGRKVRVGKPRVSRAAAMMAGPTSQTVLAKKRVEMFLAQQKAKAGGT